MIMRIAIYSVAGLALLVRVVLGYASTRPDTFIIRRATKIQATPEEIFGFVNDFHKWPLWLPRTWRTLR